MNSFISKNYSNSCKLKLYHLKNSFRTFRTPMKIVIFESDDWGLDNMPSRQVFEELKADGFIDPDDVFNYCARETVEDLDKLFSTLSDFKDNLGGNVIFTPNFIVANPDYPSIAASDFKIYSHIPIDDSERRPFQSALLKKYHEGIDRGIFIPQYHGRDHINVDLWLNALKNSDPFALAGFRNNIPLIQNNRYIKSEYMYGESSTSEPVPDHKIEEKISEGISIFCRAFGRLPLTAIAPNYNFTLATETLLYKNGVRAVQAASHCPVILDQYHAKTPRKAFLGERGPTGMLHLIRNCRFEPSQSGSSAVDLCLHQIKKAFSRGYPAIIDSHRVNYVGAVNPEGRDENLNFLRKLVQSMLRYYPSIIFLSSSELASLLSNSKLEKNNHQKSLELSNKYNIIQKLTWILRERLQWYLQR